MQAKIRISAQKGLLFLPHAVKQMARPERMITVDEVRQAVISGEIIEEYPTGPRGESCLVLHRWRHRVVHVVCAPKDEYLAIITAYTPSPEQWSTDFRVRK